MRGLDAIQSFELLALYILPFHLCIVQRFYIQLFQNET